MIVKPMTSMSPSSVELLPADLFHGLVPPLQLGMFKNKMACTFKSLIRCVKSLPSHSNVTWSDRPFHLRSSSSMPPLTPQNNLLYIRELNFSGLASETSTVTILIITVFNNIRLDNQNPCNLPTLLLVKFEIYSYILSQQLSWSVGGYAITLKVFFKNDCIKNCNVTQIQDAIVMFHIFYI